MRDGRLEFRAECLHAPLNLGADGGVVVPLLYLKIVLQEVDNGQIRHLLAVGDAPAGQPRHRLVGEPALELQQQSGLADPRLAHEQDDLPSPCPGLGPALLQEGQFGLPSTNGVSPRSAPTSSRVRSPRARTTS